MRRTRDAMERELNSLKACGWCSWAMASALALGCGHAALRGSPITAAARASSAPVRQLALGYRHTCALTEAGDVWCWGDNREGQTLPGGRPEYARPVQVGGLHGIVEIAAGGSHTCARRAEGEVLCWGDGRFQLRSQNAPSAPQAVAGLRDVVELVVGERVGCARSRDGRVACWEASQHDGDTWQSEEDADLSGSAQVAIGASRVCALRSDGGVRCRGLSTTDRSEDVGGEAGGPSGLRARVIAVGTRRACAIRDDGSVVCWAADEPSEGVSGDLEREEPAQREALAPVAGLTEAVALSVGDDRACARRRNGEVVCWSTSTPLPLEPLGNFAEVRVGASHECVRRGTGEVMCRGFNTNGQLAVESPSHGPRAAPFELPGVDDVDEVVAGDDSTCARRAGGVVTCWGFNTWDELGDGTGLPRAQPGAPIAGISDVVQLAGRGQSACAVRRGGSVTCWGRGFSMGGSDQARTGPVALPGASDVVQVALDGSSVCAIRRGGRVLCWGPRAADGPEGGRPPVEVPGLTNATGIASGGGVTCAALTTGRVACWGRSVRGAAREGAPTLTPRVEGAVQVTVGEHMACASRRDGTVVCWIHSRHGDAHEAPPDDPRFMWTLPGIEDAASASIGEGFLCVSRRSGGVACQGDNELGQLGSGEVGPTRDNLAAVVGLTDARGVTAGAHHACAWLTGGRVACWGDNRGRLGTGGVLHTPSLRPVVGLGETAPTSP